MRTIYNNSLTLAPEPGHIDDRRPIQGFSRIDRFLPRAELHYEACKSRSTSVTAGFTILAATPVQALGLSIAQSGCARCPLSTRSIS